MGPENRSIVDCSAGSARFRVIVSNWWEKYRVDTLETKEPETVEWLLRRFGPGDILFDIGANIGIYTLLAASNNPRGTVIAVEPMPANVARLCDNVAVNALGNVTPCCLGASAKAGLEDFHLASLESGSSMHSIGDGAMTREFGESVAMRVTVPVTTIDLLAERFGTPALVKIDVDGAEDEVLSGAAAVLRDPGLRSLLVEFNWTNDHPHDEKRLAPLSSAGFEVERAGISYQWGEVRWQNFIFSRPD
jgi:FkbM family methyltransferase